MDRTYLFPEVKDFEYIWLSLIGPIGSFLNSSIQSDSNSLVIASCVAISDFLFDRQNWFKLVENDLFWLVIASYFAIFDFLFGIPHCC